jgi:lipopolysaccharide/colanic/teichoic acid biosynthesis glycosyltransferase
MAHLQDTRTYPLNLAITPSDSPPLSAAKDPFSMPFSKRALDIAICVAALPILALFTLVMTIVLSIGSPGPVFFRQVRVGYKGRLFKVYKFRTMTEGADTSVHQAYLSSLIGSSAPMVKMDSRGDSRLVPGGWLLRATGLDELPQVINVLRGEMSFIGPRPCLPYEYEQYLPWQRHRFNATPGLTGLWQVSGKNRTTFEEMIRLDIQYAELQSLGLDLKIILKTIPALIRQIQDTRNARAASAPVPQPLVSLSSETAKSLYTRKLQPKAPGAFLNSP